eukprot:TRINITY_DN1279_c0_g2_i2.p1 TRINITY_DN1279_c0_g2~~TRINITY_DN1279_c0_g2_i2.p1  ORF type:complete len:205 (-),score=41.07 TRINITY_DN1279_c0_g2_i2:268-882(-)
MDCHEGPNRKHWNKHAVTFRRCGACNVIKEDTVYVLLNDQQEIVEGPLRGYSVNKNRRWEMLNDKSVGKLYVERRFQCRKVPTRYWEEREDGRLVVKGDSDKDSHGGRQARKQKRQAVAKQGKDRVPDIVKTEKSQDSETSNSTTNPNPNILLFGSNSHDRFRSVAICRACGKSGKKWGLVTDPRNARMKDILGWGIQDESLVV